MKGYKGIAMGAELGGHKFIVVSDHEGLEAFMKSRGLPFRAESAKPAAVVAQQDGIDYMPWDLPETKHDS